MMPSDPMAQCSNAPPANVLYMPSNPPPPWARLKYSVNAVPFKPGMRIYAINRHTANKPNVNKIRDFSSGILKQLANVLKMLRNMSWSRLRFRRFGGFADDHLARAALGLDLGLGRGTECVRAHREFPGQFTLAENLDSIGGAIGQT